MCVLSNGAILDDLGAHFSVNPEIIHCEKLSPMKFMFIAAASNNRVPYVSSA